jgi:universal stress protein A
VYKIRRILITTDFSEYAASALEYALSLADAHNADLHILHVVEHKRTKTKKGAKQRKTSTKTLEENARRKMNKFVAERIEPTVAVRPIVLAGHPASEIVRYARSHSIDVIVVATHGRTGLAHAFLGSIAERVVRYSPVPVLAVKPAAIIERLVTEEDVLKSLHITSS